MSEMLKSPPNSKEYAKKETQERKRNILYLIEQFLRNNSLQQAADCLAEEAQLSTNVEVCDNVDLDIILQEYQSYYYVKFQKMPKITKKVDAAFVTKETKPKKPVKQTISKKLKEKTPSNDSEDFQFEIISISNCQQQSNSKINEVQATKNALLKPLCDYEEYSTEWRELAEQIQKDVLPNNLGVKWSDCIGLHQATNLLKEAVVYPISYPHIFTGLIKSWKGNTLLVRIYYYAWPRMTVHAYFDHIMSLKG